MTSIPNYVSNSELAARLSALVERWATRESEMVALLTQPEGVVTLTDGVGNKHTLASYNGLLSEVERMVDELHGVTAATSGMVELAGQYANASANSATTAGEHADRASATVAVLADATAFAEGVVSDAQATAAAVDATASGVRQNALDADEAAIRAAASAAESSLHVATASGHAVAAGNDADEAAASAALAALWASAPSDTPVRPGEYSAYHWANVAARLGTGALIYMGGWDASTGAFPADPALGHFYKVTTGGTVGDVRFNSGDQAVFNGTTWDLIDNTDLVQSVNGKVGAVVLAAGDISGLGALAAKSKVDFASDIVGLPAAFIPTSHTHTKGDVGLPNVDNTADVDKPVSTATRAALNGKANLSGGNVFQNSQYFDNGRIAVRSTAEAVRILALDGQTHIQGVSLDESAFAPLRLRGTSLELTGPTNVYGGLAVTGTFSSGTATLANGYHYTDASGNYLIRPSNGTSLGYYRFGLDGTFSALSGGASFAGVVSGQRFEGTTNNPFRLGYGSTITHGYISWHTTSDTTTRTAYMGFGSADTSELTINNELGGRMNLHCQFVHIMDSSGGGIQLRPNGDIYKGDANNRGNQRRQPRIFVQAGDPGAAATDGDLWIW